MRNRVVAGVVGTAWVVALVAIPIRASAQGAGWVETAVELRERALAGNVAYAIVEGLTRMGPRLAGTSAEHRAAAWGAERLRALGFANVAVEEFPLLVWTRGEERGEIVAPYAQPLVVTLLGGSPGTPAGGVEGEAVLFET